MRWLIPSSMRPTSTISGVWVAEREVAEHREPERKGDRHAGKHRGGDNADEEDQKIEIAELMKDRRREPEQRDQSGDRAERQQQKRQSDPALRQPQHARKTIINATPDRQRGGAPGIGDLRAPRW